jgi:hypothetical protein
VQGAGLLLGCRLFLLRRLHDLRRPKDCKKYDNIVSKMFGFVFRSDRRACIMQIRENGLQGHAEQMALSKRQTIRR